MSFKAKKGQLLPLLLVCLVACSSQNESGQRQFAEPTGEGSNPNRKITFREGCEVGCRYTTIEKGEVTLSGESEPMVIQVKYVSELVKIDEGFYTWKTTSTYDIEDLGTHRLKEGARLDKNRVKFLTTNAFGNRVSAEGEEPDEMQTFNQYPEKSVSIGDSWNGYSLEKGRRYKNTYTLEDLVKINGKEYAIVSFDDEEKGGFSRGKFWVELSKGITHKAETEMKFENDDGKMVRGRSVSHVIGENGKEILP